jgi:hypothetical protein
MNPVKELKKLAQQLKHAIRFYYKNPAGLEVEIYGGSGEFSEATVKNVPKDILDKVRKALRPGGDAYYEEASEALMLCVQDVIDANFVSQDPEDPEGEGDYDYEKITDSIKYNSDIKSEKDGIIDLEERD